MLLLVGACGGDPASPDGGASDAAPTDGPRGDPAPRCSDGIDNDGDGQLDFPDDPECASADDDLEGEEPCIPVDELALYTPTSGSVSGDGILEGATCATLGGEHGYRIEFPGGELQLFLSDSAGGPKFYLRREACAASTEIGCAAGVSTFVVPAGTYYVIVDGASAGEGATYSIEARYGCMKAPCPDGLVCHASRGVYDTCGVPECRDGVDNPTSQLGEASDDDGLIDFPADPGCSSPDDDTEIDGCTIANGYACPSCANGDDDDGDGNADYPADDDCEFPGDTGEHPRPKCGNELDDDGDGQIDFPADPDCTDAADPDERPACKDQIDNDDDGMIDFPADPGCLSSTDPTE
jgi:hypothetical protein